MEYVPWYFVPVAAVLFIGFGFVLLVQRRKLMIVELELALLRNEIDQRPKFATPQPETSNVTMWDAPQARR